MSVCSKCGGEMIQGEAYIDFNISSGNDIMSGMMLPTSGMNLGSIGSTREGEIKWREKTGEKIGFLFKSDETRSLQVKGRRCKKCGYIEFFVG